MCGLLLKKLYLRNMLTFYPIWTAFGKSPWTGAHKKHETFKKKVFHYCKPVEGWDVKTESKTALKYEASLSGKLTDILSPTKNYNIA